jgi:predicted Zn-ribbon and HTH transcriptional regulator
MDGPTRTSRQQIMDLIEGQARTSRELAHALAISEREVESHLAHIARSVMRDRARRFLIEPAACATCDFVFRDRTRLTRPSRCPRCRSEHLSAPRFAIERRREARSKESPSTDERGSQENGPCTGG